jgi:hypothetical protein
MKKLFFTMMLAMAGGLSVFAQDDKQYQPSGDCTISKTPQGVVVTFPFTNNVGDVYGCVYIEDEQGNPEKNFGEEGYYCTELQVGKGKVNAVVEIPGNDLGKVKKGFQYYMGIEIYNVANDEWVTESYAREIKF